MSRENSDRPALVWEEIDRFVSGQVTGVVQSTVLANGNRRYSYRIGRTSRTSPDKPFPFLGPRDIHSQRQVLSEIEICIENARECLGQDRLS